jgi:uncharacterized protein YbaP (TraB family)
MDAQRALIALARILAWVLALAALPFAAAADSYLWEVSSLTNRVYLYGTVHAGRPEWYPLPYAVESAYADSKVLVVEADITDEESMRKSVDAMTYKPPDSLKNHVSTDDYARFRKLLARYTLAESQVAQLKPFMAVSLLVFSEWGRNGFLPQYGVDGYFIKKAKGDLKKIVEIEGVDEQIRLMDSLTEAEMRTLFEGTLAALESGLTNEQIAGMVGAWQFGDPNLMLEIARRYNDQVPGAKEFEEKFIWSRHPEMLARIEGYLTGSRDHHFIAVGALHLSGPRGLLELLRKRGYIVKQL